MKKQYKAFEDLSYLESENGFLEGTGSLIFDERSVYVCYSERANKKGIEVFEKTINQYSKEEFKINTFSAFDRKNRVIYHTNCMMAVLKYHIVICLESITSKEERASIEKAIRDSGKKLIDIDYDELEGFCANILSLVNRGGEDIVVMSSTAKKSFKKAHLEEIEGKYRIIAANIETIEKIGGGSARCMIAEIY
jgi:hypothetical protein